MIRAEERRKGTKGVKIGEILLLQYSFEVDIIRYLYIGGGALKRPVSVFNYAVKRH